MPVPMVMAMPVVMMTAEEEEPKTKIVVREAWPTGQSPLYAETEVRLAAGAEWRW